MKHTLKELLEIMCNTQKEVEGHEGPVDINSLLSEDLETYLEKALAENSTSALELLDVDLRNAQEYL